MTVGSVLTSRLSPLATLVVSVVGASLTVACSILLDADVVQCRVDADCVGRGSAATCVDKVCVGGVTDAAAADAADAAEAAPADPKGGCLGNVTWGTQDISTKVLVRQRFVRLLGEGPITKMTINACGRLDPDCTLSLGTGVTDDSGYANLSIPKYFEGFLKLDPPATFPTMVPSLITVIPPPEKDSDPDASIPANVAPHLTSAGELNALLALVGSKLNPALGNVLGIVLDCQGNPTAGVELRIDQTSSGQTVSYYTDATGTPSVTATETAPRGEAGFVNTPTGPITITATVPALSRRMGRYTVISKAGTVTYLPMSPGPN